MTIKPNNGNSYFTGRDIESEILPKSGNPPSAPPLPKVLRPSDGVVRNDVKQRFKPQSSHTSTTQNSAQKTSNDIKKSARTSKADGNNAYGDGKARADKEGYALLHPFLRIFLSPTLARAQGNPASIWTVKLTTEKGGEVKQKYQDFHIIVCWYSFLIGAIGGVAVGLETEFFSNRRLPPPNIPLPGRLKLLTRIFQYGVQSSSSFYRFSKRALISGYLFDVIEKNIEQERQVKDWINMGLAGGITGAFFGLRGGLHGTFFGSIILGGFASVSGFYYFYKKRVKQDP